jgi:hypothetical protein
MTVDTLFLDMDGFFVNFAKGACLFHGKPYEPSKMDWNFYAPWGLTDSQFWSPLQNEDFWANLEPHSDGVELVNRIAAEYGWDNLAVLSSASVKGSVDGKRTWLRRHFPKLEAGAVFATQKQRYSGYAKLLLDDHDPNVEKWRAHPYCGHSYLIPRPWNKGRDEVNGHGEFDVDAVFEEVVVAIEHRDIPF